MPQYAFSSCTSLTNVLLSANLKSIGNYAFYRCSKLNNVIVPENVTYIGTNAFCRCGNLTDIVIPASVSEIGGMAFGECVGLVSVTCHAVTPLDCWGVFECSEDYTFYFPSIYDQATLFVPAESEEDYRNHEEWGRFSRIVPFIGAGPGDVNGNGEITISDVTSLIDLLLGGGEMPSYVDVNGDGTVSIKDVTVLIDILLGVN